jgi:hypothetical protein
MAMICRTGLLLLTTAALAAASDPVAAILDQARGAPVEIFADVVFNLLDANRIAEKDRVALLDELFLRAGEAHQPMAERPAELASKRAVPLPAQLHLDKLAIQSRVVRAMLDIDGKHARELFNQIPPPDVPKPDCTAVFVFDPTVYYDLLAAVVTKAAFTDKEQADQIPFWTVESAVRGIHTSIEIVAAARNLSHLAHTEKEALAMSTAFAAALGIDDSNRNFSAAVRNVNLAEAVLIAADRYARLGVPPQAMLTALRSYLVRHLAASRCADNPDGLYDSTIAAFNAAIGHQTALPPITAEEGTPAKVEGTAAAPKPSSESGVDDLRKAADAVAKDPAAADLGDVLERIRAWNGAGGQDPLAVFHMKVSLYYGLLGMNIRRFGPDGPILPERKPGHEAVLSELIAALSDPARLELSPEDWLTEVREFQRRFTSRMNAEIAGQNLTQEVVASDVAQAMMGSSLSALQVYGKLAVLEHSAPSWARRPN